MWRCDRSGGSSRVGNLREWKIASLARRGPVLRGKSSDHRVIDGGPAARAIRVLEAMLNGPVLDELRALAGTS